MRHSCNVQLGYPMGPDDVVFSSMPFFWIGGLVTTLFEVLHLGATLVTQGAFDAGLALELIEQRAGDDRDRVAAAGQDHVRAPVVREPRSVRRSCGRACPTSSRPTAARPT